MDSSFGEPRCAVPSISEEGNLRDEVRRLRDDQESLKEKIDVSFTINGTTVDNLSVYRHSPRSLTRWLKGFPLQPATLSEALSCGFLITPAADSSLDALRISKSYKDNYLVVQLLRTENLELKVVYWCQN